MTEPEMVIIEAVPGSTRSRMLTVQNPSEETLKVTCAVEGPPGLKRVALGSLTGDDFNCAGWSEVSPQIFTLRGGGQRNIDFAKVQPGLYLLTATMSYVGQHVSSKLPIRVETEEGEKR